MEAMNQTQPAAWKYRIKERVRWGDVDAARIIFYGAYIRFFEIAETELFRAVGLPYGRMFDELDVWLPRAPSAKACTPSPTRCCLNFSRLRRMPSGLKRSRVSAR